MSLEKRRLVQDMVLTYKIIFGLLDIDSRKFFFTLGLRCANNVTRDNLYKLSVSNCRINVRQHYFAERVVSAWNSLSPSDVDFSSLSAFKRTIHNARLNLYTKY